MTSPVTAQVLELAGAQIGLVVIAKVYDSSIKKIAKIIAPKIKGKN